MADSLFPFVLVDAMYLKVREDGRVRSRGIMIAIGVNTEGYREVLGLMLGDTESEASWSEFFSSLKGRGLRGVWISLPPTIMAALYARYGSSCKG
ncbi:transposase [Paenibacillus larvae]|nr:transposase [Paenibacillus larvae]MDT2240855.1 transposase [Paenibacillus larvae]